MHQRSFESGSTRRKPFAHARSAARVLIALVVAPGWPASAAAQDPSGACWILGRVIDENDAQLSGVAIWVETEGDNQFLSGTACARTGASRSRWPSAAPSRSGPG